MIEKKEKLTRREKHKLSAEKFVDHVEKYLREADKRKSDLSEIVLPADLIRVDELLAEINHQKSWIEKIPAAKSVDSEGIFKSFYTTDIEPLLVSLDTMLSILELVGDIDGFKLFLHKKDNAIFDDDIKDIKKNILSLFLTFTYKTSVEFAVKKHEIRFNKIGQLVNENSFKKLSLFKIYETCVGKI